MNIEVSNGEILDKLSILKIKQKNIIDSIKLNNINKELKYIKSKCLHLIENSSQIFDLYCSLESVNQKLWDIENKIRIKEKNKIFDEEFIELARSVYTTNDQRAAIKKDINILSYSSFIEEKSYDRY